MAHLYVHGGVSGIPKDELPSLRSAVERTEGNHLDLVESAVIALEDHPELNAGYGAVLNSKGRFELDAGIADGTSGLVGAVASVQVRHPITLARRVMERTPHVLLVGEGAARFGEDLEILKATTPERLQQYRDAVAAGTVGRDDFGRPDQVDTVGAVALDDNGNLAAGTSTGGVFGKMPGRVGDAPIFGAGFYASQGAAVVGTGVGEIFVRTSACLRVGTLIEDGTHPQDAVELVLRYISKREPEAAAGLLALNADGQVGTAFRGGSLAVEGIAGPIPVTRCR